MATYLVTGATGLIGRHFVAEILARPDTERVWVLVRERSQDRLAEVARDWPARGQGAQPDRRHAAPSGSASPTSRSPS